jgi:flagellar protein FliS
MSAAYARYRQAEEGDATGPEVLLKLYDGLVLHCARARQAIVENKPAEKGKSIDICINVLAELRADLDHTVAPDLCKRLDSLYDYFSRRLLEAGMKRDVAPIDEVSTHLTGLRMSWAKVIRGR